LSNVDIQKNTIWKALDQGRILYFCRILKAMKSGKGVALCKEQGLFCILFVAAWTKRMASGGTRAAGYALNLKVKNNRFTICCSSNAISFYSYNILTIPELYQ